MNAAQVIGFSLAFALAGFLALVGRNVPGFIGRANTFWRLLIWLPAVALAILSYSLTVAAAGLWGILLGLPIAMLVLEGFLALAAFRLWATGRYTTLHQQTLAASPHAEERLKRSWMGRIIARSRDWRRD